MGGDEAVVGLRRTESLEPERDLTHCTTFANPEIDQTRVLENPKWPVRHIAPAIRKPYLYRSSIPKQIILSQRARFRG